MKNDVFEGRILVVAVGSPTRVVEVHLDVAGFRGGRVELDDRGAKIRSALDAAETRMKHADGLAVQGAHLIAAEPLMLPDCLEEFFRGRLLAFAQGGDGCVISPPVGVEVGGDGLHEELLLRRRSRKVKCSFGSDGERWGRRSLNHDFQTGELRNNMS